MEKPLNVRCAEAIGWRDLRFLKASAAWIGVPPGSGLSSEMVFPYGQDSAHGWACTGPLVGIFDLLLARNGDRVYAWREWGSSVLSGPDGVHACGAFAGFVAKFVRHGELEGKSC